MRFYSIASLFLVCGTLASADPSLNQDLADFESAVKAAPPAKTAPADAPPPNGIDGRTVALRDLDQAISRGDAEIQIESLVNNLMAQYSSDAVQKAGDKIFQELEALRKARAQDFATRANAVLAEAQKVIPRARKPSDLDDLLRKLGEFQVSGNMPISSAMIIPRGDLAYASPALAQDISYTFTFATKWQDYLSAYDNGNADEARNVLQSLLRNTQPGAPSYFPRSVLLDKLVEATEGNPQTSPPVAPNSPPAQTDPDPILEKITSVDQIDPALPKLARIANQSPGLMWDWSELVALEQARDDLLAGLPVSLDLKRTVNGPVFGDFLSRIEAMELLVILPYYFQTQHSNPPKKDETVTAYLDRLAHTANQAGDLALLQRVIAAKYALKTAHDEPTPPPAFYPSSPWGTPPPPPPATTRFLAGLSQEAAEQYVPAVVSYEEALKNSDNTTPLDIIGSRLATIRAAHPDDFANGLSAFLTPPPVSQFPGMPPPMQPITVTVFPIPQTISIQPPVPAPSGNNPSQANH
jgi:hypothetical protein